MTTPATTDETCPVCGTTEPGGCCPDCGGHNGGTYGCVCWNECDHPEDYYCDDCTGWY
ncbi:hypothetical protein AB0A73_24450 [Glycomyces sp. NPDC047369]